ncbi:hypothetical protein IFM89_032342 [Coptis chinensis]|uniref:DUF547 domain-containing protein n=1 Tax=Coptis chinensis TaxID=261450 RepID=A0A835IGX2_9MAGN|nr:hypothetical protein IFM89_032342 [Coptis chinensis]
MLQNNSKSLDYNMCDSAALQYSLNLLGSDSLQKFSQTTGRDCSSEHESGIVDEFQSDNSFTVEVTSSAEKEGTSGSFSKQNSTYTYRIQLEQDVQRLREELQKEIELHSVLENAVQHTAVTKIIQNCILLVYCKTSFGNLEVLFLQLAKELLFTIAGLEITVAELEQEMVTLDVQLSTETKERRLMEYHLKHAQSNTLLVCSSDGTKYVNMEVSGTIIQDRVSTRKIQRIVVPSLTKEMPIKGLSDHPNRLSEEMVRSMKNIFISLADSSNMSSKSYSLDMHSSHIYSYGDHLDASLWSLYDWSAVSSKVHSPQRVMKSVSNVLGTGNACDPYKVRGKLSWADIGGYKLATEISGISVGKKQLEYASGALRTYRSLVEQLAKVNFIDLRCKEKLAFWINLYNALIMHAYLAYGVPQSELKLFSLMQKAAYTVGGYSFTAAAIEYGILKMKPPVYRPQTALLLALHKLKVPEKLHKFSIDAIEPLVAFALSNGMYSSPAVRIYTAENVEEELHEAQRDFIRAAVGISNKGRLLVPKMLHSFARGIIEDSSLALWISTYLLPHQAAFIEQCMSKRRQLWLSSCNCGILPFDSRFRYLFLPD